MTATRRRASSSTTPALLTIALDQLNVSIGGGGTGLTVTSGTLGIAILNAPVAAGDTRSWTAITGKDIGITLNVPGIVATVTQGKVLVNRASGLKNGVAPTAVNWVKPDLTTNGLIDFNADAGYTPSAALVDPGKTLDPAVLMPITLRGQKLAIGGRLENLDIFQLITGNADFALETRLVDVDLDGNAATTNDRLDDASLLTFGLSNLDLDVGFGGVGLSITGGSIGIAVLKAKPTAVPNEETRSWSAVTATGLALELNIPGIHGSVTAGSVRINRAVRRPRPDAGERDVRRRGQGGRAELGDGGQPARRPDGRPRRARAAGRRRRGSSIRARRCRTRRRSRSPSAARSCPCPARSPGSTCSGS